MKNQKTSSVINCMDVLSEDANVAEQGLHLHSGSW